MFTLIKWNKKYDKAARFVVRDDKTKKYTLFTPDRLNDIVWVDHDISNLPEYKDWAVWNEKMDYLENVIM